MREKSETILNDTGQELNVIGNKFRANGYYYEDGGLHMVSVTLKDFKGRIYLQGTLEMDPKTDEDWFNIFLDGQTTEYIQFDQMTTGTLIYKFYGNFTFVRASVDRSYLVPTPDPISVGRVRKVVVRW